MPTSPNTHLRGCSERTVKRWAAAALATAIEFMVEGISARGRAIMGSPSREKLANQRSSTWSEK